MSVSLRLLSNPRLTPVLMPLQSLNVAQLARRKLVSAPRFSQLSSYFVFVHFANISIVRVCSRSASFARLLSTNLLTCVADTVDKILTMPLTRATAVTTVMAMAVVTTAHKLRAMVVRLPDFAYWFSSTTY
jgi:hypothetical protein